MMRYQPAKRHIRLEAPERPLPPPDTKRQKMNTIPADIEPSGLAELLTKTYDLAQGTLSKLLIVDCRGFLDYNDAHIRNSVNAFYSKLVRRRLQENKIGALDLLQQLAGCGLPEPDQVEIVLYDQQTFEDEPVKPSPPPKCVNGTRNCRTRRRSRKSAEHEPLLTNGSTFLSVLMEKLDQSAKFHRVMMLKGGFLDFQARYPELCEGAAVSSSGQAMPVRSGQSRLSLSSLSQPCLPVSNHGPTKILPFLYLGSQHDAMDQGILKKHGIKYVVNLSISCPRPEFMQDGNFLRIPVNDSYQEKLLPYFEDAFTFLDKVRESNASVLVHCLAGISRSPTLAIAYIMRHLHMNSEEAYTYVKTKRPSISPNFNFMGQLLEFERQLKACHGREVAEQLKSSMRKVLVTPTAAPSSPNKSSLALSDDDVFPEPGSPLPESLMRRSLSCPVKMKKSASSTELSGRTGRQSELAASRQSPSFEPNANGKRAMSDRPVSSDDVEMLDVSALPPAAVSNDPPRPSAVERPRGLGGLKSRRTLNIPHLVKEDLPSPSTELSKLSFKSALEDKPLSLSFGGMRRSQTENIPPLEASAQCSQVQNDEESVEPPTPAPSVSATNPFFAGFKTADSPTATVSCFKGCDLTACAIEKPVLPVPQTASPLPPPPVVVAQPRSSAQLGSTPVSSAENPLFGSPRSPAHSHPLKSKTFGSRPRKVAKTSKSPSVESPTDDQPSRRLGGGLSNRLAQFLRRTPLPQQAMSVFGTTSTYGGYFTQDQMARKQSAQDVVRSKTGERLNLETGCTAPPKSKSESALLQTIGIDLDSPESGFVESPTIDPPYGRDPERESISSASSIEITVN